MTNTEKMLHERFGQRFSEINELSCPYDNQYQGPARRVLFVCSAGLLRSPTAANVAVGMGMNARSCGSAISYALIPISVNLVNWAQVIYFVKEDNYHEALQVFEFDNETVRIMDSKKVIWDIDDDYDYMHPELVLTIKRKLAH